MIFIIFVLNFYRHYLSMYSERLYFESLFVFNYSCRLKDYDGFNCNKKSSGSDSVPFYGNFSLCPEFFFCKS